MVIPTSGPTATHVQTKRAGRKGDEFLDFINVLLPESFVLQRLVANNELGATGLHPHDALLVAMAVLPDPASGRVEWRPINLDTVAAARRVAWAAVADDCYTRSFNYKALGGLTSDRSRRRVDFRPVIKRGNRYFTTAQTVLTEYYVLRNDATWFPTIGDNATINCLARLFTPRDYEKTLDLALASVPAGRPAPRLRSELGTKLLLRGIEGNVYTFWSLAPKIYDAGIAEFGAGDLRYQPNVGLVSGLYAPYFNLDETSSDNKFFGLISIEQLSAK